MNFLLYLFISRVGTVICVLSLTSVNYIIDDKWFLKAGCFGGLIWTTSVVSSCHRTHFVEISLTVGAQEFSSPAFLGSQIYLWESLR